MRARSKRACSTRSLTFSQCWLAGEKRFWEITSRICDFGGDFLAAARSASRKQSRALRSWIFQRVCAAQRRSGEAKILTSNRKAERLGYVSEEKINKCNKRFDSGTSTT